ncbi:MAG: beta-propeller domain-containing protein [bacterium]|nr:beta-propeller domain-containing protein [Acidimicrobiia bacterium]MCY4650639.1 beta-propeller domain-containing protein [bacterium]
MKRLLILMVVGVMWVSACSADVEVQTPPETSTTAPSVETTVEEQPPSTTGAGTQTTSGDDGPRLVTVGLRTFGSCDEILDYYIDNALELVGPYGLDGGPQIFRMAAMDAEVMEEAAMADDSAGSSTPSFTGTNVQVAGVDEADLVKTDGFYIYSLLDTNGRLRIVEVDDGTVTHLSSIIVDFQPQEMLLHQDMLLLVASEWRVGPVTRIVQVDISDRASPQVVADLSVDGSYNGSRLSDGVARLVITSHPVGIEWAHPQGSGLRAEQEAIEANKELVRNSTLGNWLPAYVLQAPEGGNPEWGQLVDCSNVLAPGVFSGLNTLSILLFDLSSGITDWSAASVVAEGDTLYATADSVYVATARWVNWQALAEDDVEAESTGYTTLIHKFDTSSTDLPVYEASGEVSGFLLNQFSMDEYQGDLRVAATTSPSWWWTEDSESHVTVLRPDGDLLDEIGSVWGLGEGERIFSVRFMGPDAYVVTFRQIDPLYALDLSDPSDPQVLGELKIPGFSSYLHPVGEDLLLGVGQDASLEGRVEGLQVSLFDVSDPTDPIRVAHLRPLEVDGLEPEYSWSPVENDHRAFLFFDDRAFIPYRAYWWDDNESSQDAGVAVVDVRSGDLALEDLLRPLSDGPVGEDSSDWRKVDWAVPQRVIVIDEWVYSIAHSGIAVHQLDTWDRATFLEYPAR